MMCCICVQDVQFPLFLLMVIDGHHHGQVVVFAFVKRESEEYVCRII